MSPDWIKVVDGIERALSETLAEAADRAEALEAHPAFAKTPGTPTVDGLRRLDDRFQGFAACVRQAEQQAAEADALLQAGQQAVQSWLTAAAAFRHKLGTWYGHSI